MSDGINEMHKEQEIRRQKEREQIKLLITEVLDSYKWVIAEDIMKEIGDGTN